MAWVVAILAGLTVAASSANAQTTGHCVADSTDSTEICFSITYDEFTSGSTRYVSLQSVSGRAAIVTPTATRVIQLKLGAVVFGQCWHTESCGLLDTGKLLKTVNSPSTSYSGVPPWHSDYVGVSGYRYQCAVAQLEWAHGSSSPTTYSADLCVGAAPDSLTIPDRERGLS